MTIHIESLCSPAGGLSVLYIAGANRSGTTLLDILLSQHPAVVSGGELSRVPRNLGEASMLCSCGKPVVSCPVCQDIAAGMESLARERGMTLGDLPGLNRKLERRRILPAAEPAPAFLELYAQVQSVIFQRLTQTKPQARLIVDSSKTQRGAARRALVLSRYLGMELRVVHLSRSPEGALASALKGRNRDLERGSAKTRGMLRGLRALADWTLANRAADALAHGLGEDRVMRLGFDELLQSPEVALAKLGRFVGLDLRCVVDAIENDAIQPPEHMIGGNRMRFGPIRFDPGRTADAVDWYYRGPCALAAWLAG